MKEQYNKANLTYNIGEMAKQAAGSIFVNFGNSDFLVTVSKSELDEEKDFFPLIVNFEEKLYSVGKIPGNYLRRESRPSEKATLNARMIDRPLRPLLPGTSNIEVQVVVTVLGYDRDFEVNMQAIGVASLGLVMGGIPLQKLVSGVCIANIDNELIAYPSLEQRNSADALLYAAGHKEAINMIEFEGNELSEDEVIKMLDYAHEKIKEGVAFQEDILEQRNINMSNNFKDYDNTFSFSEEIRNKYYDKISNFFANPTSKVESTNELSKIKEEMFLEDEDLSEADFDKIVKDCFVNQVLNLNKRLDGRGVDDIRDLSSRIDLIKMTHGSSLFTRGETQALAITTLGIKKDEQVFDSLEDEDSQSFFLHYNFPPYSVGEVGRIGSPGRREIGHGALAQKSFEPVLPFFEDFPYTIRVVSEVLESNGSSSQATVCATSMSLMDAGVPVSKHVAGIAMGLIKTKDDFTILSDITGFEDHMGDMDFKVAGTVDGITAIQMDIKISGIDSEIFKECLNKAKVGRLHILDHMNSIISKPRESVKDHVMKIKQIHINPAKIKDVIGRGGETINSIIEKTNVKIDITDDGNVNVYGEDQAKIVEALEIIGEITKEYEVGEVCNAKVTRIEKYGAFVNLEHGKDALLHISDISKKRIDKVEDVLSIGDEIKVKVISIEGNKIKVKLVDESK